MNLLYFYLNRINFRLFFYFIIPFSNTSLAIYIISEEKIIILSNSIATFFSVLISPYIIGALWIFLFTAFKNLSKQQNIEKTETLTPRINFFDFLDFEHITFKEYQKWTVIAWIIQLFFLILEPNLL